MNTLVKKEIRLVLPAFVGALALAIVPIWLQGYGPINPWSDPNVLPAEVNLFGILLLALSSYGREMGLKTLPFTLAQPVERARIWRTKLAVLAGAAALVYDAWLTSTSLRCCFQPGLVLPPHLLAGFGFVCLVFITSGLWMTLLLRQIVAAFWLAILVPAAIFTAIDALGGSLGLVAAALFVYAVTAFFLARRRFLVMQDTAWTGGVIAFTGRRAVADQSSMRERSPWTALLWKEVRLQQVTLLGMALLLVLHLAVVALRRVGAHTFSRTTLMVLDAFGALWFVVPLLAGSQSVAEERKIGAMQAHLCLPMGRLAQWFLKLAVALVVGGLSSWVLFWAVENVAGLKAGYLDYPLTAGLFLLLALAGFYGSTLTSGLLQALAAAVLILAGLWGSLLLPYLPTENAHFVFRYPGSRLCTGSLPFYVGIPLLMAAVLRLAYRNFGSATESWRLWRRNALALTGMAALSFVLTIAIYHRAWEWLTPLESPPGAARLSLEKPPVLHSDGDSGLAVLYPDGRLWVDRLARGPEWRMHELPFHEKWRSLGGGQFAPGANWVDAAADARETVAIRSDGTLWVSEKPRQSWEDKAPPQSSEPLAGLVRFGNETNWLGVAQHGAWAMLLLKRDGTLWSWGTNTFNTKQGELSLRAFEPRRLGTNSDWAKIIASEGWIHAFAWKKDGTGWILRIPRSNPGTNLSEQYEQYLAPSLRAERLPGLDNSRWRSLKTLDPFSFAGVRDDGTLWCFAGYLELRKSKRAASYGWHPVQMGTASDWAELSTSYHLAARKMDGSLWEWRTGLYSLWISSDRKWPFFSSDFVREAPVRLGNRNDWAALGVVEGGITSLAADGNLWSWPNPEDEVSVLGGRFDLYLAASRKPALIENILSPRQ